MSETPASTTAPSKFVVFLRRLGSAVVLWGLLIVALFIERKLIADSAFLLVIVLLGGIGLVEFYGLIEKRGLVCFKGLGIFGGLLLLGGTFFYLAGADAEERGPAGVNDFEIIFLILMVLGLGVRQLVSKANPAGFVAIATTLLGVVYVAWLLNFIQRIHYFPDVNGVIVQGNWYVLYFILVTKSSDMGAYLTGSLIGRHKMIPRVSPGKTWEGFGGAIVFSTGVSVLFACLAGERLAGMNLTHALILGVLLSGAAVVGDLIESLFKREAGVKDSGRLFPGIGGVLDVLDSLLFNAPLMYLYLRYMLV